MTRELSPLLHFTSMFQKSGGSPSDVPPTKDKVDLDNLPPEVKGHVLDHLSYEQEWKELPPLLHRRNPVLMHMYVDQSSKSYHILAAGSSASGEESLSRITELYDSRTGQWERVGDLPGPAFALNEYQSGVFENGNIFCTGFVDLGDQTVKGILGYNVKEGIWSTKWTAEALPISTILQLVENNGELFLFSERDNGPVTEHCVDRIEWTPSEGDDKNTTFELVNVSKKEKSGDRGLEVYPECFAVSFNESRLCIYNTVDHSEEVFDIEDQEKCEAVPALRARMTSAPSFERFLPSNPGRFILRVLLFLTCLSAVIASPEPATGPSTSQMSTTYPTVWYVGIAATIVAAAIAVTGVGIKLYRYFYQRERGDSLRDVLDVLTSLFREHAMDMDMNVGSVKVREASVDDLRLRSSLRSSAV